MSPLTQSTDPDIVAMLLEDHQNTAAIFARFDDTPLDQRGAYFAEFVSVLLGHEAAEEKVVYPALRSVIHSVDLHSKALLDERVFEGSENEVLLKELGQMDPASAAFAGSFAELRDYVLEHAEREEQTVFPLLDRFAESIDRGTMGSHYIKAKGVVPVTRHPGHPW